jgi:hypothetical protein
MLIALIREIREIGFQSTKYWILDLRRPGLSAFHRYISSFMGGMDLAYEI